MSMSKQTTFTLTLLVTLSVIVPGSAGYLSARMDAVEQARRELVSLENRLRQERLAARAEKTEQTHRARRSRQIQTSTEAAPPRCEAPWRSRQERGTQPSGPMAFVPVPIELDEETLRETEIIEEGRWTAERERSRKSRERREQLAVPGSGTITERTSPPPKPSRHAPSKTPASEPPQAEVPTN